jgi:glycosidase
MINKNKWYNNASFYHIYALGFCGGDFERTDSLTKVTENLDYIKESGFNALYIGPLFESRTHGYDTTDYFRLDRRLGTNEDLKKLVNAAHEKGIKIIFDGVFNHVGRDFFAFQDVLEKKWDSEYKDWFAGINFDANNYHNDGFSYDTWEGHEELVKLNLYNSNVKQHLLDAVKFWIDEFDVDGIRLDAADCLNFDFIKNLRSFTDEYKSNFWLMGEIIHGDYRRWMNEDMLHSVTNYEAYKGLYSSFNDKNFFEIAYSLDREFGDDGMYKDKMLYTFLDNHDVDRIESKLKDKRDLYPLYTLMYMMPGTPSVYYGSEWGISGKRTNTSDRMLRPVFDLKKLREKDNCKGLYELIQKLNWLVMEYEVLRFGGYKQVYLNNEQIVFKRETETQIALIGINTSDTMMDLPVNCHQGRYRDILNENTEYCSNGNVTMKLHPKWVSVLILNK